MPSIIVGMTAIRRVEAAEAEALAVPPGHDHQAIWACVAGFLTNKEYGVPPAVFPGGIGSKGAPCSGRPCHAC